MQFSEFNLTPDLLKGIEEAGYAESTVVQQETLTHTLTGKDVFVQSQTGTGKTAAFLISLFELIRRGPEKERALVISPTRELAVQIAEEAKLLSLYLDYNIATIFGGVGYAPQLRAIADGIDILIGTPGRLIDMCNRKMINLHHFNYVVIDEADRMFDMGFVHDVQTILRKLPPREARQTMLFSATLSSDVKRLAASSMNDPVEVHIASENITVEKIDQEVYHVGSTQKMQLLLGLLKKYGNGRALIFVNMKHMAEEIAERLRGNGFEAEHLTGDLAQNQRQRRIDAFKNAELPILVATDVAARGIHVDDLELVVNFDIPMHAENYVHRIGRTARAGKSGHAVTLACETYVEFLAPVEAFIKMKIPPVIAEDDLYFPDATSGKHFGRARREFGKDRRGSGSSSSRSSGRSGGSSSGNRRPPPRSDRPGERSGGHGGGSGDYQRNDGQRSSGNSGSGRSRGPRSGTGSSGRDRSPQFRQDDNREREVRQSAPLPNDGRADQHTRPPRKDGEGRIPSSHSHDKRSFEKQQHHQDRRPHESAKQPEKKKGFFSKVISMFKK